METEMNTSALSEFNKVLIRIESICAKNADLTRSHFSAHHLAFVRFLVVRLPIAPKISINDMKQLVLTYTKDERKLDIIILPSRIAKCTITSETGTRRSCNSPARTDYLTEVIRSFYQGSNTFPASNPIVTRAATTFDYPYLSAMMQYKFGMMEEFSSSNIRDKFLYSSISRDQKLGILSCCGIGLCSDREKEFYRQTLKKDFGEHKIFKVSVVMTHDAYYGLGLAEKNIRKALQALYDEEPNAWVIADLKGRDMDTRVRCHSALMRCGFTEEKHLRGKCRFYDFQCASCAIGENNCSVLYSESVCTSFIYLNEGKISQ